MEMPRREARCRACSGRGFVSVPDLEELVARRKALGATQVDVARQAGWQPHMVSALETGARPFSAGSATRYLKALDDLASALADNRKSESRVGQALDRLVFGEDGVPEQARFISRAPADESDADSLRRVVQRHTPAEKEADQ